MLWGGKWKAGSYRQSNLGHLWLEPPVLCHSATTAGQPPTLTILYIYCIYFQHEARCFEHLEWENHSAWVLFWWREFSSQPLMEFRWHILSGYWVCDWGIQHHLCSACRGLWGLVVVQLSWLSGRALAVQARGVLGLIVGLFTFLYFHFITSKFIAMFPLGSYYKVWPTGCSTHELSLSSSIQASAVCEHIAWPVMHLEKALISHHA